MQLHASDFPITPSILATLAHSLKRLHADAEGLEIALSHLGGDFTSLLDVTPKLDDDEHAAIIDFGLPYAPGGVCVFGDNLPDLDILVCKLDISALRVVHELAERFIERASGDEVSLLVDQFNASVAGNNEVISDPLEEQRRKPRS